MKCSFAKMSTKGTFEAYWPYGTDLYGEPKLDVLLEELCKIEGNFKLKFMTSHPKDLSDELIEVMAKSKKICRQLHLPVQAGSTAILNKMNRRYIAMGYGELGESITKKINYKTIQDFASQPITDNDKEKIVIDITTGNNHLKLSSKFSNREYNTLQAPTRTKTNRYKRVSLEEILPI